MCAQLAHAIPYATLFCFPVICEDLSFFCGMHQTCSFFKKKAEVLCLDALPGLMFLFALPSERWLPDAISEF
jgi:hypothetical protein